MLPPLKPFLDPKFILRERMKAERKAAAKTRPDAAIHAARNFMSAIERPKDAVIGVYYPIGDELNTEPLTAALVEEAVQIALPVVTGKKLPLTFKAYTPGDTLIDGAYGELVPGESAALTPPDIVVVPLLAFTRDGGRLGYGGGYYDRTLELLRKTGALLAVGYAYGAQEVDGLPLSPLDQPLDWIVTERGATKVR